MYDTVRVEFMDGSKTTIVVHEDEDVYDELAALEDEQGEIVANFSILCTIEE
jgi:hypothetical protein